MGLPEVVASDHRCSSCPERSQALRDRMEVRKLTAGAYDAMRNEDIGRENHSIA